MRTLKKTLCLALALVLCLGLASAGFAAGLDDFTDADQVGAQYEEAVAVLIGTGIVDGMTGGTEINPTGALTREQAAKIITYMVLGKDIAERLTADSDPFDDVKADRWSAGYISYCVNEGIIVGFGDDTFRPTDELTGYQFAAMVLRALGFGLNGEYEGSGWTINVAKDAFTIGLFAGDAAAAINDSIQRQQAMLIAFNGLDYAPNGETSEYVVKNAGGTVLYRGTDAVTALVMQQANAGSTLTVETTKAGSLGDTVYGLTEGTKEDDFGRVSKTYTNGKSGNDEVVYASFEPTALLTYTAQTTKAKITSDLKALGIDTSNITLNMRVNGATSTDLASTVGGNGTLIQVYATSTANTYEAVIIHTYVKVLAEGDIKAATADKAAYITIDGKEYETDAFKAGDVVLYTATDSKIVNVVKANSVSGTVTATASGYFRINGERYELSYHNDSVTIGSTPGYTVSNNTYTYYLDSYGYVIHAIQGETAPVETSNVYVIATASTTIPGQQGDNLFETTDGSAAAQAKVIDLTTGTVSIKNIGIVKGNDNKYYYANMSGAASSEAVSLNNVKYFDNGTTATAFADAGLYEYTELADGSIVLGDKLDTSVTIEKNKVEITTGLYANASTNVTVFEYNADYTTITRTEYVGVANFPETAISGIAAVDSVAATGAVNSVVIVRAATPVAAPAVYAVYNGLGEYSADGQAYGFYVNGELVNYYLASGVNASTAGIDAVSAGDVVTITLTDGKLAASAVAAASEVADAVEVTYVTETYFVAGGTVYTFATTGCQVINAETKAADTIEIGDTVTGYGADANNIAFVVVAAD